MRTAQRNARKALLVQEKIQELHLDLFSREDRKERPMQQPSPLKQHVLLGHFCVIQEVVDLEDHVRCSFSSVSSLVKLSIEDEGSQRSPRAADLLGGHWTLRVLSHHAPVVLQQLSAESVVATVVLKLGILNKAIDDTDIQVKGAAELLNTFALCNLLHLLFFLQNFQQWQNLFPAFLELHHNLLPLSFHRGWSLFTHQTVSFNGPVNHVRLCKELQLGTLDGFLLVEPGLLQKIEHGEDQVPVQKRHHLHRQVILHQLCGLLRSEPRLLGLSLCFGLHHIPRTMGRCHR
mmetsp:Transcript_52125/g.93438  ORF Transcript_52125/g.93438 Transcript_52125/m.93438 type:complete len:290 (+) Transcript_52125:748-1617(+)